MNFRSTLTCKIDSKTKPLGALGELEILALQIGELQQTLTPVLSKPAILVFASDHGIAQSGVSAYPAEVTVQMVLNFLAGGAAINVFCHQHQIDLHIVDAGVNYDFGHRERLIDAKITYGTRNFLEESAMTGAQLQQCFKKAAVIVKELAAKGCNVIGFGEMGIGNTSSASLLMSSLCQIPLDRCVGEGTGLKEAALQRKLNLLLQAQQLHPQPKDALEALKLFGGFEIAQMSAGMLSAYEHRMLILVDGFIATVAYLCALQINSNISRNAVFCHQSSEQGHRLLLKRLEAKPLVNLGMRLGEGTGCALAYPIIESAVRFLCDMASFESAKVSTKLSKILL